ncbi:hypothetical protein MKX03_024278 [Papaver bracteatum]|nr:hypothetical protein MKX03_024278 [Papaver bracteatum]
MKTSLISQEDVDGWKTINSKKGVRSGNSRSLLNKNGLCCWIEAKGFSFTKGYGNKSGKIQIIETKGDRFSTLWINQKGLSWFLKGLLSEISKPWSKSQVWKFSDMDEWLTVTRGRNNNGEYMKLSGPNSWGNTVDIYFPAGNQGEGWKKVTSIINQLCPIQGVSQIKSHSSPAPNFVPNPRSSVTRIQSSEVVHKGYHEYFITIMGILQIHGRSRLLIKGSQSHMCFLIKLICTPNLLNYGGHLIQILSLKIKLDP